MSDQNSNVPSDKSFDGVGETSENALVIQQKSQAAPLATCRFINRRNGSVTVSVFYSSGGSSNGTLRYQNDYWDLHVQNGDCYCWDVNGPCQANCSLRCYPGGTYYVG